MAVLAFNRREVKGERIYFIPAGTSVDSVTVAIATWPDASPTSNWTDFEMDDIEMLEPGKEVETETFVIPSNTDGYDEDEDQTVKANFWTAETAKTNALVKMIEYGLATLPVANTAQVPFARKENYVEGVLLKETVVRGVGVTERLQCWARVYLETPGNSSSKTSKVKLKFRRMASANNTFVIIT